MAALYQRARPVTFDELVGQEHVKDVLEAAVRADRTTHAYLFSGPRGVGKTTTARLLAMAVNCEDETEGAPRPCGRCESCLLVRSVSHPDVIELDAASNNSVEDVRELQARVGLASMRGGKRVWILDEAHMLSKAAANALLKTLEEPPGGLIFVLATTEPEKLPPTILSRCQHFRFRRLADAEIVSKLTRLCEGAGLAAEPAALELIARSSDGGMRDAESLLERLMVTGSSVSLEAAEQALGLPPQERLARMGAALLAADLESLLADAADLYRDGYAPRTIAEQLARTLRSELHAALAGAASWGADAVQELVTLLHALDDEAERFVRQNDLYALEVALIKSLNATTSGSRAHTKPAPDFGAGRPAQRAVPDSLDASRPSPAAAQRPGREPRAPQQRAQGRQALERPPREERTSPAEATAGSGATRAPHSSQVDTVPAAGFSWHAVRSAAGPQLKAFLHPAQVEVEGHDVTIRYDERHAFHRTQLSHKLDEFEALLAAVAGPGYRVHVAGAAQASAPQRGTPAERGAPEGDGVRDGVQRASADSPAPQEAAAARAQEAVPGAEVEEAELSDLELAGFDEDAPSWHNHSSGEDGDYATAAVPREATANVDASVEKQAAELLKDHRQTFAGLQELFPGRVTDVTYAAPASARFGDEGLALESSLSEADGALPPDPDDSGEPNELDEREDEQPDETQGRITFT